MPWFSWLIITSKIPHIHPTEGFLEMQFHAVLFDPQRNPLINNALAFFLMLILGVIHCQNQTSHCQKLLICGNKRCTEPLCARCIRKALVIDLLGDCHL